MNALDMIRLKERRGYVPTFVQGWLSATLFSRHAAEESQYIIFANYIVDCILAC